MSELIDLTDKLKIKEGLEMARCAQANLENAYAMNPHLRSHPMMQVVDIQIRQTIEALEDNPPKQLDEDL